MNDPVVKDPIINDPIINDAITNNTNYVYQCASHSAMFGTMKVKNMDNI